MFKGELLKLAERSHRNNLAVHIWYKADIAAMLRDVCFQR
jgi:hypothetical protein